MANLFAFNYYSDAAYSSEIEQPSFITESFYPLFLTVNTDQAGDVGTVYVKLTNALVVLSSDQNDSSYLATPLETKNQLVISQSCTLDTLNFVFDAGNPQDRSLLSNVNLSEEVKFPVTNYVQSPDCSFTIQKITYTVDI